MIPKRPLTPRGIEALKPAPEGKRKLVWDGVTSGLAVRVTDMGVKSFVLVRRFPGSSNPTARSLGRVGTISLEAARVRAREWLATLADGHDPAAVAAEAKANTVKAVCEEWWTKKAKDHRTAAAQRSRLERLVYPALGAMPITQVRRSDIWALHDRITEQNGPVIANRVVQMLRGIFAWKQTRSDDWRSPIVRGMNTSPETARDRVLTDDELRALWRASGAEGSPLHPAYRAFVRFLLLTGARRTEAREMRWAEIREGVWTLPASRNKVGQELVRPLSGAALAALPSRSGEFVFSRGGVTALGALSELKAQLDRESGVSGWVLHDLRRTSRSLMSRAGVPSDVAELCLGHVIGGVRGVYDRYKYSDEKRLAYEKLATLIAQIVDPQPNVVALRR
jgi:integrase